MTTWTERVKSRMQVLELTQEKLAQKLGITRGAVTHYLAGRRVPPLKQFHKIATLLKCDPAWLQYGAEKEFRIAKVAAEKKEKIEQPRYPIPILSWDEAAAKFGIKKTAHEEIKESIPNIYTDKAHWFALRVRGDSMTATSGLSLSFHDNDIIIVDTELEAKHGNFVIAILPKSKGITFKQYVTDSGKQYLKPINPQYPIIEIDAATRIYGVVVHCLNNL